MYVAPFLEYVEDELTAIASNASPGMLLDRRIAASLQKRTTNELPGIAQLLQQVATEFVRPGEDVNWQNVGNSCRESLKTAIRELVERKLVKVPDDVPLGDVKRIAEVIASSATSDSRETLAKLVSAVWNHAQVLTHRETTKRDDAFRLFTWTVLAIGELLDAALPEKSAVVSPQF